MGKPILMQTGIFQSCHFNTYLFYAEIFCQPVPRDLFIVQHGSIW